MDDTGLEPVTSTMSRYVDHSVTLQSARYVGYDLDAAIDRRADSVAACNVNVAWITNLPNDPATVSRYVTAFRERGIEIVAGSGHWYIGEWNYARTGGSIYGPYRHLRAAIGERVSYRVNVADDQVATIMRLIEGMPVNARPWKWSLADEPPPSALSALRQLADRCRRAGIPTTLVQVPEYHQQTLTALGASVPLVCEDVYPWFKPGLGPVDPVAWCKTEQLASVSRCRTAGVQPLIMTQGFGDASLFALPSLSRTRWQIWSAVAAGSPGVVVFAHGLPRDYPGSVSLVDWDRETEQLTAHGVTVRDAFARLKTVETRLAGATLETTPKWVGSVLRGDCVAVYRSGTVRTLIVVADPDAAGQRTLKVTLPGVSVASPLASSTGGTLQAWPWPWSLFIPATLQVAIQPGEAWVGEIR